MTEEPIKLCAVCKAAPVGKSDLRCRECNRIHVRDSRRKLQAEVEFLRERNTVLQAKLDEQTAELSSLRVFYKRFIAPRLKR